MLEKLKNLLANEPTLFTTAIRLTLLAGIGLGLQLSPDQIVLIITAVEGWLAIYARMNVTPTVKVEEKVQDAAAAGHAEGRIAAATDLIVLDAAQKAAAPPGLWDK